MTIASLISQLQLAELNRKHARAVLEKAVLEACPHKIGSEFEQNGMRYRVRGLSVSIRDDTVGIWLTCDYRTTAKRWSQSTKTLWYKVEDSQS